MDTSDEETVNEDSESEDDTDDEDDDEAFLRAMSQLSSQSSTRKSVTPTVESSIIEGLRSMDLNRSRWTYDTEGEEYVYDEDLCLPKDLFEMLFEFQVVGIEWMQQLFQNGAGGILADDMGMGKTFTTCAHFGGLLRTNAIRQVLIVVPLSVVDAWQVTIQKLVLGNCAPRSVQLYVHRTSSSRALSNLANKCICIATYDSMKASAKRFQKYKWDYMVLDEGHMIKNHLSARHEVCQAIARDKTFRVVVSGTPLMNRLPELWALLNWATAGRVLGCRGEFMSNYNKPIEAARDKNASPYQLERGYVMIKALQEEIQPYFLQRTKEEYLADKLPKKTEIVVWAHLSDKQRALYEEYARENDQVQDILRGHKGKNVLACLSWLRKLCGHARLAEHETEMEDYIPCSELDGSGKILCVRDMVQHFRSEGHVTLIFSQSTMMLDIIETVLYMDEVNMARIDGTTPGKDRQKIVDEVNGEDNTYEVVLLSTGAGGVGLTLTGADRVIVYDPSWNPAGDNQAIDRAYRIGQIKEVIAYRLITAGTVEEKMYGKQVFKDGLRRTLCQTEDVSRYFDQRELSDLFKLGPEGECETMDQICQETRGMEFDWEPHEFVQKHDAVVGLSRHDGFYLKDDLQPNTPLFDGSSPPPKQLGSRNKKLDLDSSDEESVDLHNIGVKKEKVFPSDPVSPLTVSAGE